MTKLQVYDTSADAELIRQFGNAAAIHAIATLIRQHELSLYQTPELTSTLVTRAMPQIHDVVCTQTAEQPVERSRTHWLSAAAVSAAGVILAVVALLAAAGLLPGYVAGLAALLVSWWIVAYCATYAAVRDARHG